jgi:hypothetical protein
MPLAGSTRGPGREKSTFPASPNFSNETGLESAVAAESRPVGSPGGSLLACSSASARLWPEARSARRLLSIRSIALRMLSTLLNSSACRRSSSAILLERREETTDARTPRRWMAATSARKFSSPETNKCGRQGERSRMQRHRQPRRVSNHRTLYRCHFPCCQQDIVSTTNFNVSACVRARSGEQMDRHRWNSAHLVAPRLLRLRGGARLVPRTCDEYPRRTVNHR